MSHFLSDHQSRRSVRRGSTEGGNHAVGVLERLSSPPKVKQVDKRLLAVPAASKKFVQDPCGGCCARKTLLSLGLGTAVHRDIAHRLCCHSTRNTCRLPPIFLCVPGSFQATTNHMTSQSFGSMWHVPHMQATVSPPLLPVRPRLAFAEQTLTHRLSLTPSSKRMHFPLAGSFLRLQMLRIG